MLVTLASRVAPPGSGKALRALRSRRGVERRFAEWARKERDTGRPLLWVHAPSVGEGLQALPLLKLFRARRPNAQIAYTYYSPSAERFAASVGADFADYLPFDTRQQVDAALDSLRPAVIAFSKVDVWPTLVERAAYRGIKLALLSATMPESSRRNSGIARLILADAYHALDAIGAIDDADAVRLIEAGVRSDRITVTGDTRYDQVWERAQAWSPGSVGPVAAASPEKPTLVAGSTWPADEQHLLSAWSRVVYERPGVRLIIAPHEVTPKHLDAIETWAREADLSLSRLGEPDSAHSDVVLVDQYGALGDLYALAHFAYVGGGFHDAGLHSLLEPAAFGAPVIIGPRHTDNRDARLLIAAGAAFRCESGREISSRIVRWIDSPEAREKAGHAAREVVRSELGAAERSYAIVEGLLGAATGHGGTDGAVTTEGAEHAE